MFSDKIDSMMNLTKTTNTALAVVLGVVPSHISRIRKGTRNISKSPEMMDSIAEYFSSLDLTAFQKKGIAALLSTDLYPENQNEAKQLILEWLYDKNTEPVYEGFENQKNSEKYGDTDIYLGIKGKQEAVVRFLNEVKEHKGRQTLLLYSDESMEWMIDPEFFPIWKKLLVEVLEKGNKIKIIHTVNRNSVEMAAAIYGWMSLYATGLIYPYYCSESHGTYRRTLFIAPGTAVLTSQSVMDNLEGIPNIYIKNPDIISAFTKEYNDYLNFCKPLMQRYIRKSPAFISLVNQCSKQTGNTYFFQPSFTDVDLPVTSDGYDFYHIICLNPLTKEKSKPYLKKILKHLKNDEHYHVLISSDKDEPYSMYSKENCGVFVMPIKDEHISFFFNEVNIKKGFNAYLKNKIETAVTKDRKEVISEITEFTKK